MARAPVRGDVRSGEQSIPSPEEALARGDHREALALCARAHGPGIGRLCMALTGSQAEADELVHEVLLLAYDAFPSYRAEGTLRSWLFGIARRVCARHLEKRTRQTARLRLVDDGLRAAGAEELAIAREEASLAREGVNFKDVSTGAYLNNSGTELGKPCRTLETLHLSIARLAEGTRRKIYAGMFFLGLDK